MGRFKRKKFEAMNQRKKKGEKKRYEDPSNSSTHHMTNKGMSPGDRKIMYRYLQRYREGAFAVLYNNQTKSMFDKSDFGKSSPTTIVANCRLAPLTMDLLQQPYVALPKNFTSSQRRAIHEICSDIGLYHVAIGPTREDRFIIISIYHDGIQPDAFRIQETISSLQSQTTATETLLRSFKPWALQQSIPSASNHHLIDTVQDITKNYQLSIQQLCDQPGNCLRDGLDGLDLHSSSTTTMAMALEQDDLSHIPPPSFEPNDWMLVDTPEKMQQCVMELESFQPTEIAFDLECYNRSEQTQVTCLLQIAAANNNISSSSNSIPRTPFGSFSKEYVIDPLAPGVWDQVHLLRPLFANPKIVKIGHSIGGLDVRCLHRDFGIFVLNAFDTYEAARCLRLPTKGLAQVCQHYGLTDSETYTNLKAAYQTCDWTNRPLTEQMLCYGRYDVHYLVALRKLMMRDLTMTELLLLEKQTNHTTTTTTTTSSNLTQSTSNPKSMSSVSHISPPESNTNQVLHFDANELRMSDTLRKQLRQSQQRCLDLWTHKVEPPLKNSQFHAIVMRCKSYGINWTESQYNLFEKLASWRETVAANEGCMAGFVCSLGFLALVALHRPTSKIGLKQVSFTLPAILQEREGLLDDIFVLVQESRIQDAMGPLEDPASYPSYTLLESNRKKWMKEKSSDASTILLQVALLGIAGAVLFTLLSSARSNRRRI